MPSGTREVGPYTRVVAGVLTELVGDRARAVVARAAQIDRSMFSRMLDGLKPITIDDLVKICGALGTTPRAVIEATDALMRQSGEEMPPPLPEHVRRAVLDHEVLGETRPDRVVTDDKPGRSA